MFTSDQLAQLESAFAEVLPDLDKALIEITYEFAPALTNERAREFALHGVGRRLGTIRRCIAATYAIFPPQRTDPLSRDDCSDIGIYLQASIVNVAGSLDNLAWVYVCENALLDELPRRRLDVGLFTNAMQQRLPTPVREYLAQKHIRAWHDTHAKNFRDALVHRIPLYVPPHLIDPKDNDRYLELDRQASQLAISGDFGAAEKAETERDALTRASHFFTHSLSPDDPSEKAVLHAQMIADANTVLEISRLVFLNVQRPTDAQA